MLAVNYCSRVASVPRRISYTPAIPFYTGFPFQSAALISIIAVAETAERWYHRMVHQYPLKYSRNLNKCAFFKAVPPILTAVRVTIYLKLRKVY
jgi:hypothetical protein